jgi:hypothetical protein
MEAGGRPLKRWERALVYGALGCAAEVAFTGVTRGFSRSRRDRRLKGHSYLWMLPIYAVAAYLFEPLHDALDARVVWKRATVYAAAIMAVECATGTTLRLMTGSIPWDYTGHSRFAVARGAVRLDYAPVWAFAGLALEQVHDALRAARVGVVDRRDV